MNNFAAGTRVHILAIGGSGMSAIARILNVNGCQVSGSDSADTSRLQTLRVEGIDAYVGHDAENMLQRSPQLVVYSAAIPDSNEELQAARNAGIAVLSRADAVAELMATRDVIEVMGTHGKTTTASMAAMAALAAGVDVSYLVGSEIAQVGSNARWAGPVTVVEGDESDASGFRLAPSVLVVTNLDVDHMDFWPDQSKLLETFEHFAAAVCGAQGDDGVVIACADDPGAHRIAMAAERAGRRVITYGTSETADVRVADVRPGVTGQTARITGAVDVPSLRLRLPGLHNLRNAAAVIALAHVRGWSIPAVVESLSNFQSTRRRFEVIADVAGITVIDDYAHHPTAVAATIAGAQGIAAALREAGEPARVVAVCQPYRWYRTAAMTSDYADSLSGADVVLLLDVYGPGEQPIGGAGSAAIAELMTTAHAYVREKQQAIAWVLENGLRGDLVLTLGGEDVRTVATDLAAALPSASAGGSS